jgi:hypothetical protein
MSECDNTPQITDNQMEDVINELEHQCARNIKAHQVGIEYDDHIICDVCRRFVSIFKILIIIKL